MKNFLQKNQLTVQIVATFFVIFILISSVVFFEQNVFQKNDGKANAAGDCPGDYVYVEASDFCIEKNLHDDGDVSSWSSAAMGCVQDDGARLCIASEWVQACELSEGGDIDALNNITDDWEWVDEFTKHNKVIKLGDGGCKNYNDSNNISGGTESFRCCKNAIN